MGWGCLGLGLLSGGGYLRRLALDGARLFGAEALEGGWLLMS